MKMISAGADLGLGVKDDDVIFMFETNQVLGHFLDSGWSGSAQTDAAAKAGGKGEAYSGAAEVAPDVWVYPITKNRLTLQATLQGTKYRGFGQESFAFKHQTVIQGLRGARVVSVQL